jgi:hypothetical protein
VQRASKLAAHNGYLGILRGGSRLIRKQQHKRVDGGIRSLDVGEVGVDQFHRRDLMATDALRHVGQSQMI